LYESKRIGSREGPPKTVALISLSANSVNLQALADEIEAYAQQHSRWTGQRRSKENGEGEEHESTHHIRCHQMKKVAAVKKLAQRYFDTALGADSKVIYMNPSNGGSSASSASDAANFFRWVASDLKLKPITWRDVRPYMLAERISFELNTNASTNSAITPAAYLLLESLASILYQVPLRHPSLLLHLPLLLLPSLVQLVHLQCVVICVVIIHSLQTSWFILLDMVISALIASKGDKRRFPYS